MRAEVIRAFKDLEAKMALRKLGEIIEASDERIGKLAKLGFVKPIEEEQPAPQPEVEEVPVEEVPEEEPKPKAKAKRKSAKKK